MAAMLVSDPFVYSRSYSRSGIIMISCSEWYLLIDFKIIMIDPFSKILYFQLVFVNAFLFFFLSIPEICCYFSFDFCKSKFTYEQRLPFLICIKWLVLPLCCILWPSTSVYILGIAGIQCWFAIEMSASYYTTKMISIRYKLMISLLI